MTILVPMPPKPVDRFPEELDSGPQCGYDGYPIPDYNTATVEDNLYGPMLAVAAAASPGGSGDPCPRCMSTPCICYSSFLSGFGNYVGADNLDKKLDGSSYKNLGKKDFVDYGASVVDSLFGDALGKMKDYDNLPNKIKPEDPFDGYGGFE